MEPMRMQEPLETPVMLREVAPDPGDVATVAQFPMVSVDAEPKNLTLQRSPARTPSLLPPFGVSQPSHLPTPQSPGDLTGYLAGPGSMLSPLSSEYPRSRPSRQLINAPPSRPVSTHPPKTAQREPSTPSLMLSRTFPPPSPTDMLDKARATDPSRSRPSQVATPSPEVSRMRRASVPNSPFEDETTMTPSAKPSSSHSHNGSATLAPAPIISPANSSHSTIYQSPEFHFGTRESSNYRAPHNMEALVEGSLRSVSQTHSIHLADPFIVGSDEGCKEGPTGDRYPSPMFRNQHRNIQGRISPSLSPHNGERASTGIVTLPRESPEIPSFSTPVKAVVDHAECDVDIHTGPIAINGAQLSQEPEPPRTPPPGSPGGSEPRFRMLSLDQPSFRTSPRPPGGELERIHRRQADLIDAHIVEDETHRLDLIRAKRDDLVDTDAPNEREDSLAGLGVTVTPIKGRRLKLYRPMPTSITDGVLTVDSHHDLEHAEPKTSPPPTTTPYASFSAVSRPAIDWRTPGQHRMPPAILTKEEEHKKQKRLAAFTAPESSKSMRRLKAVEVPGRGRMIIDITSEETRAFAEAGLLEISLQESHDDVSQVNGHGAEWPDSEYPWSLQKRQHELEKEAEKHARLRWIERFLDRESESEEDEQEAIAGPSTRSPQFDIDTSSRPQRGRGKSISLLATPGFRRTATTDRHTFGSANADAREVLLSKRHVRAMVEKLRRRKLAEEEEGVVMCICQGADDGRPMVRCDNCRTWYHLVCMDIADESELGDEWFCFKCTPEDPPPAPVFQPTFAPVMPDTPPRTSVGDLPLYQTALQPSPMLDLRSRAPNSPSVPTNLSRDRDRERSPLRRSRLPHYIDDPDDPVRGGPSTPYHAHSSDSRLYSTPNIYEDHAADEYVPFDPTSTPSRGLKFPNAVPLTPRRPPTWAGQGLLWATPSGLPRTPQFPSQTPSSSTRSLGYSLSTMDDSNLPFMSPWTADDSPVRRPHKPSESNYPYPLPRKPQLDSPLVVRGGKRLFPPGVEESPTARYIARSKDRDFGELTSRLPHGHSPRRE